MMRILILEPYYGGSHKYFIDELQAHIAADYTVISLPARKWKMRMQLSALWFVEQINKLEPKEQYFDRVLCSSFIDLSVFKALLSSISGWNKKVQFLVYFHENQFEYPLQYSGQNNLPFSAINFNSALAADSIGFNSNFNKDTFINGCGKYLRSASDMKFFTPLTTIEKKSVVLYPGIDFTLIDKHPEYIDNNSKPVIVWNHRWEHDKNPGEFFDALYELHVEKEDFSLLLLGQQFEKIPENFSTNIERLRDHIIHCGFCASYDEYISWLNKGDIIVSTAHHEFYGIAVIEAVRCGCTPLLPNRLSYPELFDERYLYSDGKFVKRLKDHLKESRIGRRQGKILTDRFSWSFQRQSYENWLL